MNLWKPAKSIIPAKPHVCGKCGGLRREWLKAHRRHAGIGWLHAVCQCCGDNPCDVLASVDITFSGVDATMCSSCFAYGGNYAKPSSLSLDGTYNVTENSGTPDNPLNCNNVCLYRDSIADVANGAVLNIYTNSSCTGSPSSTESNHIYPVIHVDFATGLIDKITAEVPTFGSGFEFAFYWIAADCSEQVDFGESVSNQASCVAAEAFANGGTAMVTKP